MRLLRLTLLVFFAGLFFSGMQHAGKHPDVSAKRSINNKVEEDSAATLCRNVVGVLNPKTNLIENYIFDHSLYKLGTDALPQVKFWRNVMNLHEDTALLCLGDNRDIIRKISFKEWNAKPDSVKKFFRDSVRAARNLDSSCRILITGGKKFFYNFEKSSQNLHKGITCFLNNQVDPWYAQAILLIESPNKLQKSNVGAYGPFQLMKDVAKLYGLKVNKKTDERANFERSAFAAGSLIKKICVPKTRAMLDSLQIYNVDENELWFRLLVMHVYHAGAYNVQKALMSFNPCEGGMDIIYTLWHTNIGRFKSASQNYSQLVLAAMLEMDERSKVVYSLKAQASSGRALYGKR